MTTIYRTYGYTLVAPEAQLLAIHRWGERFSELAVLKERCSTRLNDGRAWAAYVEIVDESTETAVAAAFRDIGSASATCWDTPTALLRRHDWLLRPDAVARIVLDVRQHPHRLLDEEISRFFVNTLRSGTRFCWEYLDKFFLAYLQKTDREPLAFSEQEWGDVRPLPTEATIPMIPTPRAIPMTPTPRSAPMVPPPPRYEPSRKRFRNLELDD